MQEESGNFGEDAFSTVLERLAKGNLIPQDEEEAKAALDEIMAINHIVHGKGERTKSALYGKFFFLLGSSLCTTVLYTGAIAIRREIQCPAKIREN